MPTDAPSQVGPVPLGEALAIIDGVEPVAPREAELAAALGLTLAADAGRGTKLRPAGARLRRVDLALLASQDVTEVAVRVPRLLVVCRPLSEPVAGLVCRAIEAEGGLADCVEMPPKAALGQHDACVEMVDSERPSGVQWEFCGVNLKPNGAIAFGYRAGRPVLKLPSGMDAFPAWLAVGRRLLARLAFRLIEEQPYLLELARPLVSAKGAVEVVPVRRRAAQVEVLADAWSPHSVARADGWMLVPAETDAIPAGSKVQMRVWP